MVTCCSPIKIHLSSNTLNKPIKSTMNFFAFHRVIDIIDISNWLFGIVIVLSTNPHQINSNSLTLWIIWKDIYQELPRVGWEIYPKYYRIRKSSVRIFLTFLIQARHNYIRNKKLAPIFKSNKWLSQHILFSLVTCLQITTFPTCFSMFCNLASKVI